MPGLGDYLDQAHEMQRQGEFLEALWCYESVLRDPMIAENLLLRQTTGMDMARLLLAEASRCNQLERRQRLVSRAIAILSRTIMTGAARHPAALLLAEVYGLRYALAGEASDLLAAYLLIDAIIEDEAPSQILSEVEKLRGQFASIKLLALRPDARL